jgi:hypothetical protein
VGTSFLEEYSWRLGASVVARAHSREEVHKLVEGHIQREEVHVACERAHPRGRGTHTWRGSRGTIIMWSHLSLYMMA